MPRRRSRLFLCCGGIVNCDGSWDFLPLFFCSSSSCINHDRKTSSFYAGHTCMQSTHGSQQKAHMPIGAERNKRCTILEIAHKAPFFYVAKHIQERYWEAITTLGVRIWGGNNLSRCVVKVHTQRSLPPPFTLLTYPDCVQGIDDGIATSVSPLMKEGLSIHTEIKTTLPQLKIVSSFNLDPNYFPFFSALSSLSHVRRPPFGCSPPVALTERERKSGIFKTYHNLPSEISIFFKTLGEGGAKIREGGWTMQ